jgi:hypothetical protein
MDKDKLEVEEEREREDELIRSYLLHLAQEWREHESKYGFLRT